MKKNIVTIPLYIGSKSRPNFPTAKVLQGGTVLVEPQDASLYKMLHGETARIITLPENDKGVTYMFQHLLEQVHRDGHKYFLYADDDIFGFKNKDKTPFDMDTCFKEGVAICEEKGYSQLMISFQGHNWFSKEILKEKIGAWACFIGKTEDFLAVGGYELSLPLFADWEMSAKLITKGYKTACWYQPMFAHKMRGLKGGAEILYKDSSNVQRSIEIIKQKYGEEVVREVEAHGQKEIRFNYKLL